MDYTSLVADKNTAGSIKRWVNHADLDSDQVLTEAQALIYQALRVREMRSEFSALTMSVGDSSKALPAGFLDPLGLFDLTNNIRLRLRTEVSLQRRREYDGTGALLTGTPWNFAIWGELLQFEYQYDATATLKLIGYKQPDALSGGNTTNFLTNRFPHLLRVACLAQAYAFRNNDERQQIELGKLAAYIAKTNAEADDSYRGIQVENEVI